MGKNSKRVYNPEFRKQAAKLAIDIGATKAAQQLGIPMSVAANWKKAELAKGPQPGKAKIDFEAEYKRLLGLVNK